MGRPHRGFNLGVLTPAAPTPYWFVAHLLPRALQELVTLPRGCPGPYFPSEGEQKGLLVVWGGFEGSLNMAGAFALPPSNSP